MELTLEEALQEHQEGVEALIKAGKRYVGALVAWRKACETGHMAKRQKAAAAAQELAPSLAAPTRETAEAWEFDVRAYLESEAWRDEIRGEADRLGLRVLEENETLVSSPVVVRAQPGRSALAFGKAIWPNLRPRAVAAELKRLRDRTSAARAQEFLDGLYAGTKHLRGDGDLFAKFRDIYDLFALTPGWKRENPEAAFAQQIYALHRAELPATRGGKGWGLEGPSGKPRDKDIFTVIADDGRQIRYYGIWFK